MNNQLQTAIKNELIFQFQMFELNWIHWISMKYYDKRCQLTLNDCRCICRKLGKMCRINILLLLFDLRTFSLKQPSKYRPFIIRFQRSLRNSLVMWMMRNKTHTHTRLNEFPDSLNWINLPLVKQNEEKELIEIWSIYYDRFTWLEWPCAQTRYTLHISMIHLLNGSNWKAIKI